MNQLNLLFVSHSETSKAAALAIEPQIGTLQGKVLAFLRRNPKGATDEQMQMCIPMAQSTQRPRRVELVAKGLVRDSGRVGKTRSGKSAVIWEAVS